MSRTTEWNADAEKQTLRPVGDSAVLYYGETVLMRITTGLDLTGAAFKIAAKSPTDLDATTFLILSTDSATDAWTDLAAGKVGMTVILTDSTLKAYIADDIAKDVELAFIDTVAGVVLARATIAVNHPIVLGDES